MPAIGEYSTTGDNCLGPAQISAQLFVERVAVFGTLLTAREQHGRERNHYPT